MVYCRIIAVDDGPLGNSYHVLESIIFDDGMKKKKCTVLFDKEQCQIVCSCYLFEFRGIFCKHCIIVFITNDITFVPERCTLRRWKKDVSRTYTRMNINYNGWISTPAQVRYDELCDTFRKVVDVVADDEVLTREITEWLEMKMINMNISKNKSSCGSSLISGHSQVHDSTERGLVDKNSRVHKLDPKNS
ncbi:Protein FAR1-RELATED SEQUENCE [Abeliophyllum distichum]|uniref:Protein FAR1-RELATED SEQUENCE n=1 Tax=Abeliophyllum distichum TaxID=126358 RepID=A0ABD1VQV1_9LAMI